MLAFSMNADNAMLFFEVCQELKAETEEERLAILGAMVKLGKIKSITQTKLSKEDYIKHLSEKFGNVLHIKGDK